MTDYAKRLGYGGSAVIDGTQVLITAGSFEESLTPATLDMLDLPGISGGPDRRSRVQHSPGTAQYTGSVSFDVTEKAIDQIIKVNALLQRNFKYDVGIHDGEEKYVMKDCLTTSLSLSGAPGGLITASLSFMALEGKEGGSVSNDYVLDYDSDPQQQPGAYWWSGATDVRDWSFSYNQDVAPVYRNVDSILPRYLRAGLSTYALQVNTYSEIEHDSIEIMTRAFTLTGFTTAKSYTYGGPNDLGMYGNTFETAAIGVSNNTVIT